jgi:hypothetical protein
MGCGIPGERTSAENVFINICSMSGIVVAIKKNVHYEDLDPHALQSCKTFTLKFMIGQYVDTYIFSSSSRNSNTHQISNNTKQPTD